MDSKKKLIIACVGLCVLIIAAVLAYGALKRGASGSGDAATTAAAPAVSASTQAPKASSTSGSASTASKAASSASESSATSAGASASQATTGAWSAEAAPSRVAVGEPSPDFTVYDVDGNEVKLSDHLGRKPVVINFWTSWCPYCKTEMPDFQTLYDTYGDKVAFVFVDCVDGQRETVDTGAAYIADKGFTFPVYFDRDFAAENIFNVYSYPTTAVIDGSGTVVSCRSGMIDSQELAKTLDDLLAS